MIDKIIELFDKGYCNECNKLNCLGGEPSSNTVAKAIRELQQENQQLKQKLKQKDEVIDEAIKYIEENTELEHDGDEYGYTEWIDIKEQNIVFINSLLSILQESKGDNNE